MAEITWEEIIKKAALTLIKRKCSQEYTNRLKFEIKEIEKQGATAYWLGLFNDKKEFSSNPNFLVLPWLLEMVAADPIKARTTPILNSVRASTVAQFHHEHGYVPPDFLKDPDQPDIDIDCLPEARDPIKDYATSTYSAHIKDGYGAVCSVGTWQTYKFRSAIIDVCSATGWLDKQEALKVTTKLPEDVDDLKDGGKAGCKGRIVNAKTGEEKECGFFHDTTKCPKCGSTDTDGITLGKLLFEHTDLKIFADKNPEVISHAVKLIGRIRNMGMHAGALIIADRTLYGNIPLAKSAKHGYWISMWTEGRNTQLSKFGYIKWDILGLKTLKYIFECCKLIESNRGISFGENMSGLDDIDPSQERAGHYFDGQGNKQYINLNDKRALALANAQMTDGIFQFDTDLAKSILKNGVRNFYDLMLLNAMGHPGPMASIPEAVKNREDGAGLWKNRLKKIHPVLLEVLEDTYGVICYHEDTLISMADGSHKPIREVNHGDMVHSVDLTGSPRVKHIVVLGCAPTKISDGLRIVLDNGYDVIVTPDHKIYCWDGYKRACELSIDDLVAVPNELPSHSSNSDFVDFTDWLGDSEDCAYLIGLLLGDGCTSSTSISICAGSLEAAQCLEEWISNNIHLTTRIYFHCRSYYIAIHNQEKIDRTVDLEPFDNSREWWYYAYSKYSGSDIANYLRRSTWYVYDRLRQYNTPITGDKKNSAKTKWHNLLSNLGLDCNLYYKRIPPSLMKASKEHHGAVLAGLIDTDGHISTDQRGIDLVGFTSMSPLLLSDIRQLLTLYGISCSIDGCRLNVWNTQKFSELVSPYLLLKSFDGVLFDGDSVGWVPKDAFIDFVDANYTSRRAFSKNTGVSRRVFSYQCNFVRTSTAIKASMDLGDLRYHKITSIEQIESQQFYDLSVNIDHNLVANGILASNCWQEQLASIWQRIGGFTAPEAQEARKAVAKKWTHKLKPIEKRWLAGASPVLGEESAKEWWAKMETFGRYAFNKCLGKDTILTDVNSGESMTIEQWYNEDKSPMLKSYTNEQFTIDECVDIHYNGENEVFEIEFDNGMKESVTLAHQFLCEDGRYHEVREIIDKGLDVIEAKIS